MRVVIAGGTGLIGRRLATALRDRGDEPIVLTRQPERQRKAVGAGIDVVGWDSTDPNGAWADVLRGAGAVVNLAGSSVGRWPWTASRKRELIESRVGPTTTLVDAISRIPLGDRPAVLVNASGTDVYEGRDTEPATEEAPSAGTFLADLCLRWEAAARRAEDAGVRVVQARTSLVVDCHAPALHRFARPVRLFAGGRLGSGRQWVSWIHAADAVELLLLALRRSEVSGVLNVSSPDARPQADFSAAIARVLHRPFWLPIPATLVRLALGDQATLVLGSRRVWPARALALKYEFRYPRLEEALLAELT